MWTSRHLYRYFPLGRNPHWCVSLHEVRFLCLFTPPSGLERYPAGRMGEDPTSGLSHSLRSAGFKLGRLQTGTPARLDKSTINFDGLERQDGDIVPSPFSYIHGSVPNAVRGSLVFTCK